MGGTFGPDKPSKPPTFGCEALGLCRRHQVSDSQRSGYILQLPAMNRGRDGFGMALGALALLDRALRGFRGGLGLTTGISETSSKKPKSERLEHFDRIFLLVSFDHALAVVFSKP